MEKEHYDSLVQPKAAANDSVHPLWPAESHVYVLQAGRLLEEVSKILVAQDDSLRIIPAKLESAIIRIRKAIRIVNRGLK